MERETRVRRTLDSRIEGKIPEIEGKGIDAEVETADVADDSVDQDADKEE